MSLLTTMGSTSDLLEHSTDTGGYYWTYHKHKHNWDTNIISGRVLARLCWPKSSRKQRQEISTMCTHLWGLTTKLALLWQESLGWWPRDPASMTPPCWRWRKLFTDKSRTTDQFKYHICMSHVMMIVLLFVSFNFW